MEDARRKIFIDLLLISMTLVAIISIFPYGETKNGLPVSPVRHAMTPESSANGISNRIVASRLHPKNSTPKAGSADPAATDETESAAIPSNTTGTTIETDACIATATVVATGTSAETADTVPEIPLGTVAFPKVREGIRAFPETLNPLLARDSESFKVTSMIFSGLLTYGKDLFLKGDLADSWEISEDRRKVKFILRKANWHDGTEVTSLDVKATFDFIWKNRKRCPRAEDFALVSQVVAIDGKTVRVDYKKPFARLIDIWTIPILKADHLKTGEAPVGSGPFRVVSINSPFGISLEAHENYHFGQPEIKAYEFKVLPGDEEIIGVLARGEVDMIELPFGLQVRRGLGEGVIESFPSNDCEWLLFNTGNQKLLSKDLRHSLSTAIDTAAITATVPGGATRLSGPFLSASWASDPSIQPSIFSMEKAQEQIAKLTQPLPAEITILTDSGNSWRVSAARKIAAAWRQLGIQTSVSPIPWNMLVSRVTSRNYETALIGFELDVDPDPYALWHSSSTIGGLNVTGFASPEADVLIEKGRECFLTDERQDAYRALHRLILTETPCVFLFTPARRICLSPKFKTAIFTRTGTRVDMHKWTAKTREGGID